MATGKRTRKCGRLVARLIAWPAWQIQALGKAVAVLPSVRPIDVAWEGEQQRVAQRSSSPHTTLIMAAFALVRGKVSVVWSGKRIAAWGSVHGARRGDRSNGPRFGSLVTSGYMHDEFALVAL